MVPGTRTCVTATRWRSTEESPVEQAGACMPALVDGPGQLPPLRVDGVKVGDLEVQDKS